MAALGRKELDYLYSPSRWTKKLPVDTAVSNHISVVLDATAKVKSQVKCCLDVPYGDQSDADTLDLFYPDQDSTEVDAIVLFIHGGNWCELGKEHYGYVALPLVEQGVVTVIVGFDNAPKGTMTTIVDQCRRACVYVANKFPQKRLYLVGHSAGAQLCAMLLSTDWKLNGMETMKFSGAFLFSGLYDLSLLQRCYVNDPLNLTESEVCYLSPLKQLHKVKDNVTSSFSCLLGLGEQESPEFKRQQEEYYQGLLSEGVVSSSHQVPDEDHFTTVERLFECDYYFTKLMLATILN